MSILSSSSSKPFGSKPFLNPHWKQGIVMRVWRVINPYQLLQRFLLLCFGVVLLITAVLSYGTIPSGL